MPFSQRRRRLRRDSTDGSHSHSNGSLKVLAAQTLKIASINGLGDTEKLETELEDEIRWEERRYPPSEIIGRIRRRCEEILHAKPMLLFIVVLNVIDCLLVIGELTLDFHYLSKKYLTRTRHSNEFLDKMKSRYSPRLDDLKSLEEDDLTTLFNRFLRSFVVWNASDYTAASLTTDCLSFVTNSSIPTAPTVGSNQSNVLSSLLAFSSAPVDLMEPMDLKNYDVVATGHYMHYGSISILSFLLAETLLKIACVGKRFLKKRMEVFDAVIIAVSFTLDIIFVEGLTNLHIQHYVIVLSFLLPWRVLRVLNSLIVAVMVQHRFHLKLLYKQKRRCNKQLQETTENVKSLEKRVELLKRLCSSNGVPDWQVNKAIGQSLTTSGVSGLKALSKLVFHAAESFAPMTGSQSQLNNGGCCSSSSPTSTGAALGGGHSLSTPAISIQLSHGDVEQGPSNGHAHALREESHVEDETATPEPSRQGSLSRNSGHDSRSRDEEEAGAESPAAERPESSPSSSLGVGEGEGRTTEEEEEGRPVGKEEENGDEEDSVPVSFSLPEDSSAGDSAAVNEATTTTRL